MLTENHSDCETLQTGIIRGESADEYHSRPLITRSKLDDFHDDPSLFYGRWVKGDIEKETTPAMSIGTGLHKMTLEGNEAFFKEYATIVLEEELKWGHPNSNNYKQEYAKWQRDNEGKKIIKTPDFLDICKMATAIRDHPTASALLANGEAEVSWRMNVGSLMIQSRTDFVNFDGCAETDGKPYVVDLKTVTGLTARNWEDTWNKQCWRYRYHRQAAFYQAVTSQLANVEKMIYVLVGKEAPNTVVCVEVDDMLLEAAQREIISDMNHLQDAIRTGDWKSTAPVGIVKAIPPKWQLMEGIT